MRVEVRGINDYKRTINGFMYYGKKGRLYCEAPTTKGGLYNQLISIDHTGDIIAHTNSSTACWSPSAISTLQSLFKSHSWYIYTNNIGQTLECSYLSAFKGGNAPRKQILFNGKVYK